MGEVIQLERRDRLYTWEDGDSWALIALKYCQPFKAYQDLVDLNKRVLYNNRFKMKPGDIIEVPQEWVPIRAVSREVKIIGSFGHVT